MSQSHTNVICFFIEPTNRSAFEHYRLVFFRTAA